MKKIQKIKIRMIGAWRKFKIIKFECLHEHANSSNDEFELGQPRKNSNRMSAEAEIRIPPRPAMERDKLPPTFELEFGFGAGSEKTSFLNHNNQIGPANKSSK